MNNQLKTFFDPQSIAVIGASNHEGKVGNDVMLNLGNFPGAVYPINPKDDQVAGKKAYPSITKTPTVPDLAIIVIPAEGVLTAVEECGIKGCKSIVIISSGFKEIGGDGIEREKKLVALGEKYKLEILGPNCLGYIATKQKVNASFAEAFPKLGNVAFFSQSGALGTAVLDTAEAQKLGLSYFLSLGNKCDIDELDLLKYLGRDKQTKVILSYLESITNGGEFLKQAREVSLKKPVIVLKSGKTAAGSQAVSSHTGSLAGAAEVYSAAFKQAGVIEAEDAMDFFDLAEGFAYQNYPAGNRVAILTNAGGPGILLTDWLPNFGLQLAQLSEVTKTKLKKVLPLAANTHNPVDVLGDALADRYQAAFKILIQDKNIDSIVVALTPQRMTQIKETADAIGKLKDLTDKTVVLCFMGELETIKNYQSFADNKLPQFNYPIEAITVLSKLYRYGKWRQEKSVVAKPVKPAAKSLRLPAGFVEMNVARQILLKEKFPLHRAEFAKDATAAVNVAKAIGYPVALQVVSKEVVHKSDVGGVKIGMVATAAIAQAILEESYVSFEAALQHYGIFDQHTRTVTSVCLKKKSDKTIQGITYRFIKVSGKNFYGWEETQIEGRTVKVATLEKAILDMIRSQRSIHSLDLVLEKLREYKGNFDFEKLNELAQSQSVIVQKILGFLLDKAGIDSGSIYELTKHKEGAGSMTRDSDVFSGKWNLYYHNFFGNL